MSLAGTQQPAATVLSSPPVTSAVLSPTASTATLHSNPELNNTAPPADLKTLWMGSIQPNWDEAFITNLFRSVAEPSIVRITRYNGSVAGYAFIDFASQEIAKQVLETFNNTPIPDTGFIFKLNWGMGSTRRSLGAPHEHSLFVGDLPAEVTDNQLLDVFRAQFPSCSTAKVVIDNYTGASKGYGFVRFTDKAQCETAIVLMNGTTINGRPVRVSHATPPARRTGGFATASMPQMIGSAPQAIPYGYVYDRSGVIRHVQAPMLISARTSEDNSVSSPEMSVGSLSGSYVDPSGFTASAGTPENTTVFVGNLDPAVTEAQLHQHFQAYGVITQVKIPQNRGCGFVKYDSHESAEKALHALQGTPLCNQRIRLDWGKASAQRQQQQQQQQQQAAMMMDPAALAYAGYASYYVQPWTAAASYPAAYYPTARYPAQQYMAVPGAAVLPMTGRFPQEYIQGPVPVLSHAEGGANGSEGGAGDEAALDYAASSAAAIQHHQGHMAPAQWSTDIVQ